MQDPAIEKRGLSVKEVCHVAGFGRSTFYEVVAAGLLLFRKLGRRTIVLREDLDRFLAALPVANAEATGAPADRSDNLNDASAPRSPKEIEQRPAVVSGVPPGKMRSRASPRSHPVKTDRVSSL
jgi:excisionase family DNA binding protein